MPPTASIDYVSQHIIERSTSGNGPVIVGIDGPDCAGKSTFAKNLVTRLKGGRSTLLIHFDDYANTKEKRERAGEFSVESFLYDYFDEAALCAALDAIAICAINVVIVEGLFLFRPALVDRFDLRIRIEVDPEVILARALARDVGQIGDSMWVERHYREQCLPAQARYIADHRPASAADIVLFSTSGGHLEFRR